MEHRAAGAARNRLFRLLSAAAFSGVQKRLPRFWPLAGPPQKLRHECSHQTAIRGSQFTFAPFAIVLPFSNLVPRLRVRVLLARSRPTERKQRSFSNTGARKLCRGLFRSN